MRARNFTENLRGIWHQSYGCAPCPVCQPEGRRGQNALTLSDGQHMLTKVMFAEQYARLVFDRELHDQLLTEVMATDPAVPGLTLMNVVARQQAAVLLESADAYF